MLFREEETGLREEDVLTAGEIRVQFKSILSKWIRWKDLRDLTWVLDAWFRGDS